MGGEGCGTQKFVHQKPAQLNISFGKFHFSRSMKSGSMGGGGGSSYGCQLL